MIAIAPAYDVAAVVDEATPQRARLHADTVRRAWGVHAVPASGVHVVYMWLYLLAYLLTYELITCLRTS